MLGLGVLRRLSSSMKSSGSAKDSSATYNSTHQGLAKADRCGRLCRLEHLQLIHKPSVCHMRRTAGDELASSSASHCDSPQYSTSCWHRLA